MTSYRVPVSAVREGAIIYVDSASDGQPRGIADTLVVLKAYAGMPTSLDMMITVRAYTSANALLVAQHIAETAMCCADKLRQTNGISMLAVGADQRAYVIYFPSSMTEIDVLDDLDLDTAEAA